MNTEFSRRFIKQLAKLRAKEQVQFWDRLELWRIDPHSSKLNNHSLKGKYKGFYSINIGGDLRALYKILDDGSIVLFDLIGTHSQLYG